MCQNVAKPEQECKSELIVGVDIQHISKIRRLISIYSQDGVAHIYLALSVYDYFSLRCLFSSIQQMAVVIILIKYVVFQSISKTLISIGHGLNHSKDLKDIFLDLLEKVLY